MTEQSRTAVRLRSENSAALDSLVAAVCERRDVYIVGASDEVLDALLNLADRAIAVDEFSDGDTWLDFGTALARLSEQLVVLQRAIRGEIS